MTSLVGQAVIMTAYAAGCAIIGLGLYRYTELDVWMSALVPMVVLLTVAIVRFRHSVSRGLGDMEEQVTGVTDRTRTLTDRIETMEHRTRHTVSVVETTHRARMDSLELRMRNAEDIVRRLEDDLAQMVVPPPTLSPERSDLPGVALEEIREALRANRVDLHLQPIVSLPQRHVHYYEGLTRLRRADGKIVMPAEFLKAARQAGLLGAIDNLLLFRCVEILTRLADADRKLGFFCNISTASLEDEGFFDMFADMMGAQWHQGGALVFEMAQDEFERRSAVCRANMARLIEMGYSFSIDKVDTLSVDLSALQAAGVKFMKVGADKLLAELTPEGERPRSAVFRSMGPGDIVPAFGRHGVTLIADKTENEKSIIELMEFGVSYGQGHLFGPPRPIRESLWQETTPPPEVMRRIGAA